jgi:hypothetical protein
MKSYYLFLFCIFSASFTMGQDCSSIRQGIFYEYPRNSYANYEVVLRRKDSIETSVSNLSGEKSVWKIIFRNNCIIDKKLIKTTRKDEYVKDILNDTYTQEVTKITKEYYAFRGYWQSHPEKSYPDTTWMIRRH